MSTRKQTNVISPVGHAFDTHGKVLRHHARLNRLDTHLFQRAGKRDQVIVLVQFAAVSQASRPGEDRRYKWSRKP